jgi:hypothetical protein
VQVAPAQAYAEHDAVFEGRVLEVEAPDDPSGPLRATLVVVQHWKGIEQERVVVTTPAVGSLCGVPFAPETSWLVYADREGGALSTGLCSRTRPVVEAEEDRAFLGAGVVPVEITEADEVEAPEESEAEEPERPSPPARGGCASCAVGAPRAPRAGGALLALLLGLGLAARRRR